MFTFDHKIQHMKKLHLFYLAFLLLIVSCTKSTTNTTSLPVVAYSVTGIMDQQMTVDNTENYPVSMPITINYDDSTEQKVTVSVSGVPSNLFCGTFYGAGNLFPGVMLYSGPWSGVPSYTIPLVMFCASSTYTTGTYPITVTCTNASGVSKAFTFSLNCK